MWTYSCDKVINIDNNHNIFLFNFKLVLDFIY
jgi:hypothetical protein